METILVLQPAIAILEDHPERVEHMRRVLKATLPLCERRFFARAPDMIVWLAEHLVRVVFISLDHDLDSVVPLSQQSSDPGCGRDLADWLATQPAICPVFVHTTNQDASVGMIRVLEETGWPTHRVYPSNDMAWIDSYWAEDLRACLCAMDGFRPGSETSCDVAARRAAWPLQSAEKVRPALGR